MLPRKHYFCKNVDEENQKITVSEKFKAKKYEDTAIEEAAEEQANLISSELDYPYHSNVPKDDRLHAPSIDIDFPVECYESSTPGHFHLYIERPMTWRQYRRLLHALMRAGIIEEGYYKASIQRGGSFLRKKGTKKASVEESVMTWQ